MHDCETSIGAAIFSLWPPLTGCVVDHGPDEVLSNTVDETGRVSSGLKSSLANVEHGLRRSAR
jgi:hypothetical protein